MLWVFIVFGVPNPYSVLHFFLLEPVSRCAVLNCLVLGEESPTLNCFRDCPLGCFGCATLVWWAY